MMNVVLYFTVLST